MKRLDPEDLAGAKRVALQRLSLRACFIADLRQLLQRRGSSPQVIEQVVAECCAAGYLNDAESADAFVRGQLRKRVGPHLIAMKLKGKGVDASLIASLLPTRDEADRIRELIATRYRTRDLADPKERSKVIASLIRRGYSLDAALAALPSDY